jgi:NAD(P)-dependent dehydrogenase (short-subunit alcohol dehydrogenase family)
MADLPTSLIDDVLNQQLVKRLGKPADIVAAMLFLCSDEGGSFMTGETLRVCGGYPLQI